MHSILLDEHVSRVFEGVLRARGYAVTQAKDEFGERTVDEELVDWCSQNGYLLITNNASDFEPLHEAYDHPGMMFYRHQDLPDADPEGLARVIDVVFEQYSHESPENQIVELDHWYHWLHE